VSAKSEAHGVRNERPLLNRMSFGDYRGILLESCSPGSVESKPLKDMI
jgi:hypothetical protein